MASQRKWMVALRNAGASDAVIRSWRALRDAVAEHQRLLLLNGIGRVADERERVRVNARRVGLEVPPFADEAAVSLQQLLQHAVDERSHESAGHDCQQPRQQQQQQQQQQAQQNVRDAFT